MQIKPLSKNRALAKLEAVSKIMPAADALSFFNSLMEVYREEQNLRRDLAKIEAMRDVVLTEITKRYELYHGVFDRIFDERKEAIDRHFDIIDRGIAANDKELIIQGLQGLSTIVSSSPFANLQELSKLLESGRKVEI
jgi:biopolymer transport protein ExbB/TolQ